jgi:hypothetical protein
MDRDSHVPGLEFKMSGSECGAFGAVKFQTISVSHGSGLLGWLGRTDIIRDQGNPEVRPIMTSMDPHTVRISIAHIERVLFAKHQWRDVTLLYDIDRIDYPARDDPRNR